MKKYLVDVFVPAAGQHYDVYLPAGKRIDEVITLLGDLAGSLTGGSYQATADTMLLRAGDGAVLERGSTVYDAGIRNAAHLILV